MSQIRDSKFWMLSFCWSQNLRNSALSFFRASPTSLQWHSRCFSWSNSSADEKRRLTIWSLSHLVWTALTTVTRSTSETKQTGPQRTLKATNKVDPTLWLFSCCWLMIYFPVLPKEPPSHLAEDQQIRLKSRFPPPKSLMLLIQDSPLSSQSVAAQCYFTQVIPPPPALRSHPPAFCLPQSLLILFPPLYDHLQMKTGSAQSEEADTSSDTEDICLYVLPPQFTREKMLLKFWTQLPLLGTHSGPRVG